MNKFFVLRALVLFLLYFVRCTGFEPIETSSITSTSIPSLLPQFRSHDEEAVPVVPVGTEILYWHLHVDGVVRRRSLLVFGSYESFQPLIWIKL